MRRAAAALVILTAWGCATAPKPRVVPPQTLHGVASWYGQEFAGRTTANGEIFDPTLLTAAHRTLPFGTVIDVKNVKSGATVRVRINDRGPYIAGRMIDLSYAAARQIGLIDPGSGEVEVTVVKLGGGEREAPAPYVVNVPEVKPSPAPPPSIPVVVARAPAVPEQRQAEKKPEAAPAATGSVAKFVVQVGAFAQEANARQLLAQVVQLGQTAYIDAGSLYRVRIGPFATRELAMEVRARLESAGLPAIIVAP